jgi:hypothetical protein
MAKTTRNPDSRRDPEPLGRQDEQRISDDTSRDRIAERAYELYLERGGTHGQDWEDWLIAEREVMHRVPPRDE